MRKITKQTTGTTLALKILTMKPEGTPQWKYCNSDNTAIELKMVFLKGNEQCPKIHQIS